MKRKVIIFIVLAVIACILVTAGFLIFSPEKIVKETDNIDFLQLLYNNTEIPCNQNDIIKILSKYDAVLSLTNYSSYENDKINFEINLTHNGKPKHILLGEFYIWYESGDMPSHDIVNGKQLEEELKKALNLE